MGDDEGPCGPLRVVVFTLGEVEPVKGFEHKSVRV